MDFSLFLRQRLTELGIEQRNLAAAAHVTESYVSQLLSGKKTPPAPERSDIYPKMEAFLQIPPRTLATLADRDRANALKRKLADPQAPLFEEVRALILRKCSPAKEPAIRSLFEQDAFGALERLVTQKLLQVIQRVVKGEMRDDNWLRSVASIADRSYEQMHVTVLDFQETDIFNITDEHCVTFLDPLIESWDIDLITFAMEIVLNRQLAPEPMKKFEYVERETDTAVGEEPGFRSFLKDPRLSGDVTEEEVEFLRKLRFSGRRPTPVYYYRSLQALRDPLHFQREA